VLFCFLVDVTRRRWKNGVHQVMRFEALPIGVIDLQSLGARTLPKSSATLPFRLPADFAPGLAHLYSYPSSSAEGVPIDARAA
jgi:hypothetical protein